MLMPENKIIYRTVFPAVILLGKNNQRIGGIVLELESSPARTATARRTPVGKRNRPARMHRSIKQLADPVSENPAYKAEAERYFPFTVAMPEVKPLAGNLRNKRLAMHDNPDFRRQIIEYPNIVIPDKPMHFHPAVGQFGYLAEKAHIPAGNDTPVLIPVVENIAEQYPSQTQYHDSWIRRYENERADCLSMLPADPVAHRVSVTSATGGSVRASHSTTTEGSTVTVRLTAEAGYVAGGVTVTTATGASVAVSGSGGSYSFVMPDDDVTVCASFSLRFPDVRPGSWYFEAVSWAVGGGIFNGNDDGTFAPGNTAIRAEVAVTMVQMARVMGR